MVSAEANSNKFTVKNIVLTILYNTLYKMCNFTCTSLEASEKEKQPYVVWEYAN